jgi:hypothetical protein
MTLDKEALNSDGKTVIQSFLDKGLNKPTKLQKTINPGQACLFYIVLLLYQGEGVARAELVLEEQGLFYRVNMLHPALIPCGKIVVKK